MDLLSLFVRIVFDRTDLDNGMDRVRRDADGFAKDIKGIALGISSAVAAAAAAAATAIGGLVKKSVDAYGEYEQLRGGVETLFKNGADTVIKNAENAYKTAQISEKEYFQTAISLSSSLIQGIAKSGKQMSAEELATRKKSLDSQYKLQKKAYDSEYEARQESISDEIELINKSNSKKLERIKEAHSQELEDYQKLTDNKIALIDKEYDEQLKIIDREAYERIKAIDDEINAIEAKEKAESEAAEKSAIAVQRAELEKEVRISNSAEARMKAQKALDAFDEEQAKKQAERDRANRKEALRNQKAEIKDEAQERKNAAKAEHDEKVNHVKEASQAELKAMRAAQKEQEESVQESMAEQLKIIQKAKKNELKALKEAQSDQLDALKESIEAQKDALAEGMDEMSETIDPEVYQQAAELADIAITDMGDVVNKMGLDMASVQAAYNGFSKQNYTINLMSAA
jgi:hypothetical protein